uniref:Chemokine-like receptor 1 like 2 n=1 Tax=Lepisosteus oculatus TaxID=7918 RepID=W5NNP0_LEPOC|nr:PREDICTED: chemokine-like receptor 1 isoform X1 [Lepisosteus oculatus]
MDQTYDYDYNISSSDKSSYYNSTEKTYSKPYTMQQPSVMNIMIIVINSIIFILGVIGNGIVICITGFKMKRTINTTWFLSLAVSDFLFCVFLPFSIVQMASDQHWHFGKFMCKFTSFIMFLNMFSSIFLLVIISIDRSVSVFYPVWSQNYRTTRFATVVVLIAWIISALLSTPSLIFRDTAVKSEKTHCFNKYGSGMSKKNLHRVVALTRFVFGFVIPFIVIAFCYSIIIIKLKKNRMAKSLKPFKIMTAIIVTFFLCWLPYHIFIILEINHYNYSPDIFLKWMSMAVSLAFANSCLNPILYVFMGKDFKEKFKVSFLSKIENALSEDARTTTRRISRTSSAFEKGSTLV